MKHHSCRLGGLPVALVLIIPAGGLLAVMAGCAPQPAASAKSSGPRGGGGAVDSLQAAREALRGGSDLTAYRGAVRQLNLHLSHESNRKPRPLSAEDAAFLTSAEGFQLDPEEIREVSSLTFTPLDAHYLDSAFLFRDAARALGLPSMPPADRAAAAFRWVVRQVRLRERAGPLVPPQFIVRRGFGTSAERAMVFLALLQQTGLDGCLVVVPEGDHFREWAIGVVVGEALSLFDPRLGLALPGPSGHGVASLAQARGQPAVLQQLTVDSHSLYDVTHEQASKCEILVVAPLGALAPRMRFLQDELANTNRIVLGNNVGSLLKRVRAVVGGAPVRVWNPPGDPNTPTRVLRSFVPPTEGGVDQLAAFAFSELEGFAPPQETTPGRAFRKARFELELTPWVFMPAAVRALPYSSDPGGKLRNLYAEFFAQLPIPEKSASARHPGGEEEAAERHMGQRLKEYFLGTLSSGAQPVVPFALRAGSPRDHLLRGRLEEAASQLVDTIDQVRFEQGLANNEPELGGKLSQWCRQAESAYAALYRAEAARARISTGQAAIELAQSAIQSIWVSGAKPATEVPIWLVALGGEAAGPLGDEATYLLALSKEEQAERSGSADAWQAAFDWWSTYLEKSPAAAAVAHALRSEEERRPLPLHFSILLERIAAAHTMQARALERLGKPDAARAALENLAGKMTPLEKTARLYEARRLRKPL